jgi:D-3-phosphoglycerate dehydrogenase
MSAEQKALQRLQKIVAGAHPFPQAVAKTELMPVACAQRFSISEMEGQVFARAGGFKVTMYLAGERGVPLASRPMVEEAFQKGSLEVHWAEKLEDLPVDTEILITMGAPVGREVVTKCPKLSLVTVAFTGYDHVDLNVCRSQGVTVINVPGYATDSTAQLAMGLVLEHLNRLPACHATIEAGTWACPPQEDLMSKKIGIVGTGRLGVRCAELFKAFNVKEIIGYDLDQNPSFQALGGSYLQSLAALFLEADIVVVCMPLTEQTRGIISARLLQLLRKDSLLVNVGRGDLIDEAAMASLLKEKKFRAALDVYSREPLPADDPLRTVQNDSLLMTPHVGYQGSTSLEQRFDKTVKNILAFLAGQAVNVVQ